MIVKQENKLIKEQLISQQEFTKHQEEFTRHLEILDINLLKYNPVLIHC
jgi:hypothetical protein